MKITEKANSLIKSLMERHPNTKLTIGIYHKGKTSFKLFDTTGEIPYENSLYEIGSIVKTFTTTLLAKYIHEGKMSLDDSVAKYIPELNDGSYYPTLKQLATHTAGCSTMPSPIWDEIEWRDIWIGFERIYKKIKKSPKSDYGDYYQRQTNAIQMDRQRLLQIIKKYKIEDKEHPWKYSNVGFALLGLAIGSVAGMPFFELLTERFREEFGINLFISNRAFENLVMGYDMKNREVGNKVISEGACLISAGEGVLSTAKDMLDFAKMNLDDKEGYLQICHEVYGNKAFLPTLKQGLGWAINVRENIIGHSGNTWGFASNLAIAKEKETAIVLLANVYSYKENYPLLNEILVTNWEE